MMNILQITHDLQTIEAYRNTPYFDKIFEDIKKRWSTQLEKAEAEMDEMFNMEYKDV